MLFSTIRDENLQWSGCSGQPGSGYPHLQPWDMLHSQYQFKYFWFTGCFSKIAECKNIHTNEILAIKILKRSTSGSQEPNRELTMLKRIRNLDPENIVHFIESFEYKSHTCLAFEMLDKNLHEVLKERRGDPLSLQEIGPITRQLLGALESLKSIGVIHTNIKPHNIMTVKQKDQTLRVKLIDFSLATTAAEVKRGVTMQPVAYRSPDVILGLHISEAVDMWSLGGVLASMYLGSLPFPQRSPYYLMKTLVETMGQPEDTLLNEGTNTLLYFSANQDSTKPAWRLKTPDEHKAVTGFPPQIHRGSSTRFSCLDDLVMLYPEMNKYEERVKFVHLLKMMLHMDPQRRTTPSEALIHPFFTLSELDDDTISQLMVSDSSMIVYPVMETPEELNTHVSSIHTDEEPNTDGVLTLDIEISVDETFASTKSRHCSDDVAAASSDDEITTDTNEPVSAAAEASQSTAGLADDTASGEEALGKSVRAGSNDAGSADDEQTAVSPSATHVMTELCDVSLADEGTVHTSSTCEDISSRNTGRKQLKRIRRAFNRMFRVLCCCFSAKTLE